MNAAGDLLSGAANQIGRYFSVLSVLPSALLVSYVYALVASGAWDGTPDWRAAAASLSHVSLAAIGALSLASLLVGLVLYPLQFAVTQALEGYWGISRLAVRAMAWRARHHRARKGHLHEVQTWAVDALEGTRDAPPEAQFIPDELLRHLMAEGDADRLLTQYPDDVNDIRPTRLGNVLGRYEDFAGSQYGLSAVTVVPHLAHVAPAPEVDYLDDQRTALDLAVRMVVVGGLATAASVLFLWRGGPWLLLSLVPYSLMYASYRGAVSAAAGYGSAFSVLIDLNRFALYERLGLPRPSNSEAEREQNEALMNLLQADDEVNLTYGPVTSDNDSATLGQAASP
jgi:hypothetical protein